MSNVAFDWTSKNGNALSSTFMYTGKDTTPCPIYTSVFKNSSYLAVKKNSPKAFMDALALNPIVVYLAVSDP